MSQLHSLSLVLLLSAGLVACPTARRGDPGDDDDSAAGDDDDDASVTGPATGCDPIDPALCMLPYPNDFFSEVDPTTETGRRLALGPDVIPPNADGVVPDPGPWNRADGFSPAPQIIFYLPGATVAGVPGHAALGDSLEADALTVLMEADTGTRVAHWLERDETLHERDDQSRRMLILRPAHRLRDDTRYIVAVRGITDAAGEEVPSSEAFAALRDGTPTDLVDVETRRDHFEELFGALSGAGVERAGLQLAWDFSTASRADRTGDLLYMRDQALTQAGEEGFRYTLESVESDENEHTALMIHGSLEVPLYMEEDRPGVWLRRDAEGHPLAEGTTEAPFTIMVPTSVWERVAAGGDPGAVLQYGHGLLGDQGEARSGWLRRQSDAQGFTVVATDWVGMSGPDVISITAMLVTDFGRFGQLPDRSHQGLLNQMMLTRLVRDVLVDDPALQAEGNPLLDPSDLRYYGNSQGGILGGTLVAASPDLDRGVLGVAGGCYSMMLTRSIDFDEFFVIIRNMYEDPLERIALMSAMQDLWDRAEPSGYLGSEPLPGTSPKQYLIQNALNDFQVSNLSGHWMARSLGAGLLVPANQTVWGLDEVDSSWAGSALVEFEHGAPAVPDTNAPTELDSGLDPHEDPRREAAAQEQQRIFFETGEVVHTCSGPCDPD